jgi:hypothetical protein
MFPFQHVLHMAAQQGLDMSQFASPSHHHLRSARLLELRYISHVGFHILSIDITIFSVNDTFFVIQFFHSPSGHDGGSSSHQN